jgi:hypothetical protein
MLRAYFDDSGTHATSGVIVMGGLIGTISQWREFERAWAAKLTNPLPGKPALRMFHLSHCNARDGEFQGYSEGERDAITHDFRKILIDAGLISTASAIDLNAWDELVVGPYRDDLGDALGICVENCLAETIRVAGTHPEGDDVVAVFDQGMSSQRIREITDRFTFPLGRPRLLSVAFEKVENTLPLQGADVVATESYWQGINILQNGLGAAPRAHLRHYLDNMFAQGLIVGRDEISMMLKTQFDSNGRRVPQE